jgi:hypothetical protein
VYFLQPEFPSAVAAQVEAYIRFMHGVLGTVMTGWMMSIIVLARESFLAGRRHAWNAIAASVGSWFEVDTSYSAIHGVWANVALNLVTAALFAVPLARSRKFFTQAR